MSRYSKKRKVLISVYVILYTVTMPYKHKEDMAAYMRDYRRHLKEQRNLQAVAQSQLSHNLEAAENLTEALKAENKELVLRSRTTALK